LVGVADVARVLPRLWDGQRALRFLAGLAMLALAFAANAGLISPSVPAPSAAPASVSVATVAVDEAPAPDIADVVVPVLLVVTLVVTGTLLPGAGRLGWRMPARRGPPLG
jgi:hypothetical protein